MKILSVVGLMSVGLLVGCTSFTTPRVKSGGQPYMMYTRQGSLPSSQIYRTSWPVVVTVSTNQATAKVLPPQVIEAIITGVVGIATGATEAYKDVTKDLYMYREDFVIMGTNLPAGDVEKILKALNTPMIDSQRDPWIKK